MIKFIMYKIIKYMSERHQLQETYKMGEVKQINIKNIELIIFITTLSISNILMSSC